MDKDTKALLEIPPFLRRDPKDDVDTVNYTPKREWKMPNIKVYEELKSKRAAAAERSVELREHKIGVKQRAHKKKEDRYRVITAIEKGRDTFGKIRKATGMTNKDITSALKWLIKSNKVVKPSTKTYKSNEL